MKVWVINEIGYAYNDEGYDCPEGNAGIPKKAFKVKEHAQDECKRLNEEHKKENPLEGYAGVYEDYYTVVEVELEDNDVESYKSARERVKKAKEAAKEAAQAAFRDESKALFDKYEELKSFSWRQYTPYFNDGDTCTFGVRGDEPDINGECGCDLDSGQKWDHEKRQLVKVGEPSIEYAMQEPVAKFIRQFDEDDMLAMFGDHVKVTVHRNGKIKVDDYSHD